MKILLHVIKYSAIIIAVICSKIEDYAYSWVDWAEDLERWIDFEKYNVRGPY